MGIKRHLIRQASLLSIIVVVFLTVTEAQTLKPAHLECDALITPLGMDDKQPLLSWQLQDDRLGALQTAYEVQVATAQDLLLTGKPDVWDSGRVASDASVNVAYAG